MRNLQERSSRARFDRYRSARTFGQKPSPVPIDAARGPKESQRHRTLWQLYRSLYGWLEGQRLAIGLGLVLISVSTALKLVPPAATKLVIDQVLIHQPSARPLPAWLPLPPSPRGRLVALVGCVLVVAILGTGLGLWSRWLATRASKRVQVAVRRRVFEHTSRLPLHRVFALKAGGATSLLREDAGGIGELIFSMIYNPWRAVVQLAGGLVILAWVDWRFLLVALCVAPGAVVSDRLWNRRLRPIYRDVRKQRQEIDSQTTETFGGMRVVRAFGRQKHEATRFVAENHYMARQEVFAWWWSRIVEVIWDLFLPAASAALLLFGGLSVLEGRLSLGDLMMFLVYLAMLLEPLAVLATGATQLQNNLSGFDRVLDLLAEPREMISRAGSKVLTRDEVRGRVTLARVSFTYPENDQVVIRDVTLDVAPGETIAFVGRSGAGKTTLCNLIARFYDPTEGAVRLDGIDLRDIEVESFRQLLGIVEQDVFLFDGTIAQNIAYAGRNPSRAEIERAAVVANADAFIRSFPDGYDTRIGERGVRLSGGQRQRLAIARAVLADPRIFILDEATSNLDSESESLIRAALETLMRDRTSFVIAHRLSTIQSADRIAVVDAGAIVEIGRHDELMRRNGLYREMTELQRVED